MSAHTLHTELLKTMITFKSPCTVTTSDTDIETDIHGLHAVKEIIVHETAHYV